MARARVGLRVAVFLALAIGLGTGAGVAYLRSSAGTRWLVSHLKQTLRNQAGVRLDYARGTIDPFSGAHLEDLVLTRDQAGDHLEAKIRTLDLKYRISWLARRVEVEKFWIEQPTVIVRSEVQSKGSPMDKTAPAHGNTDLATWEEQVSRPPVRIVVRDFWVDRLDLDWDLNPGRQPGQLTARTRLRGLNLRSKLEWVPDALSTSGEFELGRFEPVDASWTDERGAKMGARMVPSGSARWGMSIRKTAQGWVRELDPLEFKGAVRGFSVERAGRPLLRFASSEIALSKGGATAPGELNIVLAHQTQALSAPGLRKPVEVQGASRVKFAADLKAADSQTRLAIEGLQALDASAQAKLEPSGAVFEGQARVRVDPRRIGWILPGWDGSLMSEVTALLRIGGTFSSIHDALLGFARAPLEAKFKATVSPKFKASWSMAEAVMEAEGKREAGKSGFDVQLRATEPSLLMPGLKQPCSLALTSATHWELEGQGSTEVSARIQGEEALKLKGQVRLKDDRVLAEGDVEALAGGYLEALLKLPAKKGLGRWKARISSKLEVGSGHWSEDGTLELTQLELARGQGVNLPQPLRIEHRAKGSEGQIEALAKGGMPEVVLSDPLVKKELKLQGLEMGLEALIADSSRFELKELSASFGNGLVRANASGQGRIDTRDFELKGQVGLRFAPELPPIAGVTLRGALDLPWTISWVRGREVDFEGTARLEQLSVRSGALGIQGLSGRIPVSEHLVLEGGKIKFSHLIDQNPFERVDFERVRPLIEGAEQLRADQIHWEDRTYGPLVGYLSIEQNMLQAQRVDLSLGKGRFYSEMFANIYPASLRFGLLSRITDLDLAEALPSRYVARVSGADMKVSLRSGVVVDLNKHSVDGRIDVTRIGAPQLGALINVIDPQFEDEKMNKLRGLLGLGYPEYVKAALTQGYMDMQVGMNIQGTRETVRVPGIPISPFIAEKTADVVKKAQEGPLK